MVKKKKKKREKQLHNKEFIYANMIQNTAASHSSDPELFYLKQERIGK